MKNLINWIAAIGGILLLALLTVVVWTFKWWILSAVAFAAVAGVLYERVTGKTPKILQ